MFVVNIEAAIRKDNHYLIIKRSEKESHAGGFLSLVGGTVDLPTAPEDDILESTIKREVREEVGIEITNLQYIESKFFLGSGNEPVIDIVFKCDYASGEARIASPDEVAAIYWMTKDEILQNEKAPPWLKRSASFL